MFAITSILIPVNRTSINTASMKTKSSTCCGIRVKIDLVAMIHDRRWGKRRRGAICASFMFEIAMRIVSLSLRHTIFAARLYRHIDGGREESVR